MKKLLVIAAIALATLPMAAQDHWRNGFSVGAEGNFSLLKDDAVKSQLNGESFNDFKGSTISGSYTAFLVKGLFVRPQVAFYYEAHGHPQITEAIPPVGITFPKGPSDKDDHTTEVGIGVACFGGYRFPIAKLSLDVLTGPYYGIAINQHETFQTRHYFDLYNKSSLRWRFGVGLNVWKLTVSASFDVGMLQQKAYNDTLWEWTEEKESNVVSVGLSYNF